MLIRWSKAPHSQQAFEVEWVLNDPDATTCTTRTRQEANSVRCGCGKCDRLEIVVLSVAKCRHPTVADGSEDVDASDGVVHHLD